jgi:hypothetical protein
VISQLGERRFANPIHPIASNCSTPDTRQDDATTDTAPSSAIDENESTCMEGMLSPNFIDNQTAEFLEQFDTDDCPNLINFARLLKTHEDFGLDSMHLFDALRPHSASNLPSANVVNQNTAPPPVHKVDTKPVPPPSPAPQARILMTIIYFQVQVSPTTGVTTSLLEPRMNSQVKSASIATPRKSATQNKVAKVQKKLARTAHQLRRAPKNDANPRS